MTSKLLHPFIMFISGLALGAIARLLDIYTQDLGNIFSQMAIWILFGTLIAIYSKTAVKAMLNVLLFSVGMLITYYTVAALTDGVYGKSFIIGWTVFAFFSPVMAYLAWKAKEKGLFPIILRVGIVMVSFLSSILLFHGPRIYDFFISGILIYFLFFKKIARDDQTKA